MDCSDIPSQQSDTELYVPVSCLQQSGTDRYAEAEACSPQLQHKEYSEHMLAEENVIMKKQLQTLEIFNTAGENRMSYRSFSQTHDWCKSKRNACKDKQHNTIIADGKSSHKMSVDELK